MLSFCWKILAAIGYFVVNVCVIFDAEIRGLSIAYRQNWKKTVIEVEWPRK